MIKSCILEYDAGPEMEKDLRLAVEFMTCTSTDEDSFNELTMYGLMLLADV